MRTRLLAAAVLALALSVLAGCGATKTTTVTRTVAVPAPSPTTLAPRPDGGVKAPQAPSCTPAEVEAVEHGAGHLGVCAPKPWRFGLGAPTSARGSSGPDVSNNDPLSNWSAVHAHGHPFAYLKVIQGTRFVDSTARGMAAGARRAHVTPGGYDFLEVCATSATGEASLYAHELRADGLLSKPSFVPMGDAEWPLSVPCSASSARSWLASWQAKLHALIGRWAGFYTGAWWWNPNVGCWRPPHGVRWVSGYITRRLLPLPCGWGGVDLWQYTDAGFNGASTTDMSVLEVDSSKFTGEGSAPSPAQQKAAKRRSLVRHEAERRTLHRLVNGHHCRKGQHVTPRSPASTRRRYHDVLCPRWLKRGASVTATSVRLRHELHLGPLPPLR
jgi:GH25 family lysozyme M1 (1,4-beta-N-acetylmuramidase)